MQINLKQPEIVTAIRQYVAQQGINLAGKTVDVKFTAGRGEAGLSAEIAIEEKDMPDFGPTDLDSTVVTDKPTLSVVTTIGKATLGAVAQVAVDPTVTDEPVGDTAAVEQGAVTGAVKTSLFN